MHVYIHCVCDTYIYVRTYIYMRTYIYIYKYVERHKRDQSFFATPVHRNVCSLYE